MKIRNPKYLKGVSLVHWLVALLPILGIGAFAVDLNNVVVSKVVLQSAADAGALEGARLLYCNNPMLLNKSGCGGALTPALDAGVDVASRNLEENQIDLDAVEIEAELGHWQFSAADVNDGLVRGGEFTPHDFDTAAAQPLVDEDGQFRTFQDLNADPDEINAVRLTVRRTDMAAYNVFLNAIYDQDFVIQGSAVAYLGFAGHVVRDSVDIPVALCYAKMPPCGYGSFITPGTAGGSGIWSNLTADVTQCESANANAIVTLIDSRCRQGGMNPEDLELGSQLGIISGAVSSASQKLRECWMDDGVPPIDSPGVVQTEAWRVKVPVLDCTVSGQCKNLLGIMLADIVWVANNNQACRLANLPVNMTRTDRDNNVLTWTRPPQNPSESTSDWEARIWTDFVTSFNLKTPPTTGGWGAATPAPCEASYIYYVPVCKEGTPTGGFGGGNFGFRATESALVY